MPGNNISRAEAAERSSHLSIKHYEVLLDVSGGAESFIATTKVSFDCNKVGYESFIDAVGKRIISATLNGQSVDVSNYDGESVFLKNLQASNELVIEIEAIYSKSGEGLQRSVDPVDNEVYLYSQGETAFIRNMYPCFWWDDLWLNESFAEWSSYLALVEATKFKNSWAGFNAERKNWAYRQDQLSSTHPIATDMVDIDTVKANFDGITYAKGASVLHQLVAHVGRDNFIKGLQKYFAKHAFKNTVLSDLLVELEATSGRDLSSWVSTWLQTSGVNTLRPVIESDSESYKSIAIKQEAPKIPAGSTELRPHRAAVGLYDLKDGQLLRRKSVELDITGDLTQVKELSGEKLADLILINDHDLTYAKIRFDDRSIATLKAHLGKLNDGLSRALCWSAAWDMFRDAELSATDFIEIALTGLAGEDDITTVTALMTQLNTAVEIYASDKNRDALREKVAGALLSLLKSAKAGSDHQLQFARSYAALAHTKEQGAEIRNLLDGKFQGLKIDADLRWHLILCLVERGMSSRAEIDAELERDNTLTGALSHERCIAAFPTLEAKEAAFKKATEDESITNWSRLSAIQGYNRPIQRHLHEGFVDRYFDLILETYNTKSYEVSTSIIDLLYPSYLISTQTLAKTDAWLNGPGKDSHPTLRRHILEAKDSLERALRVRAIDK
ncbi:MAG: hypothetical protein EBX82_04640 [Actinobacteria bacterium]|nr:hypothetical protein [Actinomycetota bacterium]